MSDLTPRFSDLSLIHFQSCVDQYWHGPVPAGSDYPIVEVVSECQT